MSKFTPGPWVCFYKAKYDEWHVSVPMSEGTMKWALFDDGVRSENPEADARLIAAAPELYEALSTLERLSRKVLEMFDGPRILTGAWDACDAARALLAKVQGSPTCISSGSSDTGTRS